MTSQTAQRGHSMSTDVDTAQPVPRAVLEDRLEGLLQWHGGAGALFSDTHRGEPSKLWHRLVRCIDEMVDGVSRAGDENETRGEILEDALAAVTAAVLDGVERTGIALPTGTPR